MLVHKQVSHTHNYCCKNHYESNAMPDIDNKSTLNNMGKRCDCFSETELRKSLQAAIPSTTPLRPYPMEFVPLRTRAGFERLIKAEAVGSFHSLAKYFQGQGPLQCATTSLAVALNALQLKDPRGEINQSRLRFSKDAIVEYLRRQLKPVHRFFSVSLDEIGILADRYTRYSPQSHVQASTIHADETTCNEFRTRATKALRHSGQVIVNFSRSALSYNTSPFAGHMSPIVAYHKDTDSFLLMDVAIKSWEPVWIPTKKII